MESVVQSGDSLARVAATAHADLVQTITLCVIANRERERQRIFDDTE